jgi:hypothetical protein
MMSAADAGTRPESLMRLFGPRGNPQVRRDATLG